MAEPVRVPPAPAPATSAAEEEKNARALAERYGLEFVDVTSYAPDPDILQSVPVELMFRYNFLPYRRHLGRLVLVMADPTDITVVDDLSMLLQTAIQPAVGTPGAIQEALKRGQGTQRVLEEASESFKIQLLRDDDNGEDLSIDRIQADASPIIRLVDSAVFDALNRRASDIHIETRDNEVVIKYRIDGVLQAAMKPMAKEHHSTIISRIKVMAELDIAEKRIPQDGRFKLRVRGKTIDFRVSIMPSVHGEDAVIRILTRGLSEQFSSLRLDVLGFDEEELTRFRRFIREPYGMVLVTGPTGSGKTTTLYAALSEIRTEEDKIITIEDPVEYQLRGITQIPVNEKKGLTFARGLRSILRHDPDKIMVGEIRPETADIAIQSALTGHLVFDRHANNVIDVLGRFLNMKIGLQLRLPSAASGPAPGAHDLHPLQAPGARLPRAARAIGPPAFHVRGRLVLRRGGMPGVRRHRFQGPHGHLGAARPQRQRARADPGPALERGDQAGGARGRNGLPARVGREQGAGRAHHPPRDQQGHVRGDPVRRGR